MNLIMAGIFWRMLPPLIKIRLVLGGHAKPHIAVPIAPVCRQHLYNVLWSLRQNQPIQPLALPD